jgi:deoxyhypusine monooxygenase
MAPSVDALRACLVDVSQPIQKRTHAAFYLRTDGSPAAVAAIGEALQNRDDSALLRHELAYVLGQIRDKAACPVLTAVLSDEGDDAMVRHEAAEALGAIGDAGAVGVLEKYAQDPVPEVADTCKLSLELIKWSTANSAARCVARGRVCGLCYGWRFVLWGLRLLASGLTRESVCV